MPMPDKILRYGRDPVAYYLHKNGNFIKKLKEEEDKLEHEEEVIIEQPPEELDESEESIKEVPETPALRK